MRPCLWTAVRSRPARPRAFTLLELLLALALTGVLLGVLGFAIQVQMRATTTRRADVAQAQLARAVLRQIADDLRSAAWYEPVDVDSAMAAVTAAAGAAGSSTSPSGGTGSPSGSSASPSGGASGGGRTMDGSTQGASGTSTPGSTSSPSGTSTSGGGSSPTSPSAPTGPSSASSTPSGSSSTPGAATQAGNAAAGSTAESGDTGLETETEEAPPRMGLYGDSLSLEIDVSRMPALGAFPTSAASLVPAPATAGDVRTVAWYLANGTVAGPNGQLPTGLMRREVDRAAARWSYDNGGSAAFDELAQAIAPEVVDIAFRYFDGTAWQTEWDSTTQGGMPTAVEVSIAVADPTLSSAVPTNLASSVVAPAPATFRLVVQMPLGTGPAPQVEGGESAESAEVSP